MDPTIRYLANERAYKLKRIHALSSDSVTLHLTVDGTTSDVTDEEVQKLREDVSELERILLELGCSSPDGEGGWLAAPRTPDAVK